MRDNWAARSSLLWLLLGSAGASLVFLFSAYSDCKVLTAASSDPLEHVEAFYRIQATSVGLAVSAVFLATTILRAPLRSVVLRVTLSLAVLILAVAWCVAAAAACRSH